MVVAASPSGSSPTDLDGRLIPLRVKVALIGLALAVAGFICYGIGTTHGTRTAAHTSVGRAYASPYQVGVRADGWSYGFELTRNGMFWYDSRHVLHEGGIPPCLQHGPRFSWIRFGWSSAVGLRGDQWRSVTWVQCVHRP